MATLKELLAQREAIEQQIAQTKKEERADAIAKVHALMAEYGLGMADIGGKPAAKGKGKAKPASKPPAKVEEDDDDDDGDDDDDDEEDEDGDDAKEPSGDPDVDDEFQDGQLKKRKDLDREPGESD